MHMTKNLSATAACINCNWSEGGDLDLDEYPDLEGGLGRLINSHHMEYSGPLGSKHNSFKLYLGDESVHDIEVHEGVYGFEGLEGYERALNVDWALQRGSGTERE